MCVCVCVCFLAFPATTSHVAYLFKVLEERVGAVSVHLYRGVLSLGHSLLAGCGGGNTGSGGGGDGGGFGYGGGWSLVSENTHFTSILARTGKVT